MKRSNSIGNSRAAATVAAVTSEGPQTHASAATVS